MGCDIHMMLEHKPRTQSAYWESLAWNAINPGRSYQKFGKLAGVRDSDQPHIPPRGLPSDCSMATTYEHWLFIHAEPGNGERYVKPEDAERWVLQGLSTYRDGKKEWVSDPDQHSHSYLSLDEYRTALAGEDDANVPWAADWVALLAAAEAYEKLNHEVRFVFWFDN